VSKLPNFTERFKPPQRELVESAKGDDRNALEVFSYTIEQLERFISSINDNIRPELDPQFSPKINIISPEVTQIQYAARMQQFVVYNASSVSLLVGLFGTSSGLPYQITVAASRYFISAPYNFDVLSFSLSGAPSTLALPIVFAYNRILFNPGQYTI